MTKIIKNQIKRKLTEPYILKINTVHLTLLSSSSVFNLAV
jgi:hypothetical protein